MVFNSVVVLSVANISADAWQYLACFPERLSGHQLLDLLCCFPLQHFGRFALCLWTFFCLPPSPPLYYPSSSYSHFDPDSDSYSDSSSPTPYYHHDDYYPHSD
ncbi:hypothetical protein RHGRI_038215 [Rhododendron griersonianum]|uniref:Uncharacterized protein n=1 Tax=Rhododendron griersonianum TaxID=479676 RepID=A0AAV6HXL6_9ERIC|nr:hypothetical protein RHGRI_038215 [Rhododendron griersonianum]